MPARQHPARLTRPFDPRAIDVAAFSRAGAALEGELPLSALPRLASSLLREADAPPVPALRWHAAGVLRPAAVGDPQFWLELRVQGSVRMQCQRCLQPVALALEVDRPIRFVADEDEAARLDEEGDDDVLALTARLDLLALIEDELILALPIVPRHEVCPQPLQVPGGVAADGTPAPVPEEPDERPNPFAVLASLKKPG